MFIFIIITGTYGKYLLRKVLQMDSHTNYTPEKYYMGVCMDGSISTRQKCPVCKGKLIHNERRRGLFCLKHPEISATRFLVRFPGGVFLNFKTYELAAQQLNGLRYKRSENTFDPSDFRKDKPNGFKSLSKKYLKTKQTRKSYRDIARGINQACKYFNDKNVKDCNGADIEDYLFSIQNISEKTRYNKCSNLHDLKG